MKTFDYNIPWEISKNYTNFHYTAEQEPNPWNEIFFSHTYIAYKWTYFAIVLGVLLYACTRTIMLARFKLLKRNLLLIAFVISIIYCISPILFNVYTLLSGIPFDIILLHCKHFTNIRIKMTSNISGDYDISKLQKDMISGYMRFRYHGLLLQYSADLCHGLDSFPTNLEIIQMAAVDLYW
ncbi:hypothetical protein BDF19DRAFT_497784 [Syncephalis fuscata]|nr:hypothetical protein BDF19DRAFT_497784 [Syncephalis fuscata]